MNTVHIGRRRRPNAVAGDKGYSYPHIRCWLSRRAIETVIPNRSNQPTVRINKKKYRGRNVIERCIGWLTWFRRVATRYEKLAESYLTMIKLAMIQRCNRLLRPSDRTYGHDSFAHDSRCVMKMACAAAIAARVLGWPCRSRTQHPRSRRSRGGARCERGRLEQFKRQQRRRSSE